MKKCFECNKDHKEEKMFEVDFDREVNGKNVIETELVCEKCYFEKYV